MAFSFDVSLLDDELDHLTASASWADVGARLEAFAARHGFENVVHLKVKADRRQGGGAVFVTTYSHEWVDRYRRENYQAIDPVLEAMRIRLQPFDWRELRNRDAATRAFFDDAVRMGVGRQGLTVPVRGADGDRGVFSVTSNESDDEWDRRARRLIPFLQILGHALHQRLRGFGDGGEEMRLDGGLTPRERDVLRWAAAGKTTWETAVLLGLSEQTVQGYMREAVRRLGVANKTSAVAEAVRRGLI